VTKLLVPAEELKSVTLHSINLQIPLREYALNYDLQLALPYDHESWYQQLTLKLMTDMTRTGLIVRTEDTDGTEEEALAHIEAKDTVEEIHTVDLGRRNAMSVTDQAVGQPSTLSKNDRKHMIDSATKRHIQQNKMLRLNSTAAFLSSTRDLREFLI
jgi:hypothetical protein